MQVSSHKIKKPRINKLQKYIFPLIAAESATAFLKENKEANCMYNYISTYNKNRLGSENSRSEIIGRNSKVKLNCFDSWMF